MTINKNFLNLQFIGLVSGLKLTNKYFFRHTVLNEKIVRSQTGGNGGSRTLTPYGTWS